jgi:two-component sensor histidine kinase
VSFTWYVENTGNDDSIVMEWAESGRPNIPAPEREGFGGRVIRFIPGRERNGKVDVEYRPGGFYCRISFVRPKPVEAEPGV